LLDLFATCTFACINGKINKKGIHLYLDQDEYKGLSYIYGSRFVITKLTSKLSTSPKNRGEGAHAVGLEVWYHGLGDMWPPKFIFCS